MLFGLALGLATPWKVVRSGLEEGGVESKFLYVDIAVEAGAQTPCPVCAQLCPLYDHEVMRWRHLNFWQHPTYLRVLPGIEWVFGLVGEKMRG